MSIERALKNCQTILELFVMQEIYVAKRIREELDAGRTMGSQEISRIENEFRDEIAKGQTKEDNIVAHLDRFNELISMSLQAEDIDPVGAYREKFGRIAAEFGDTNFFGLIRSYWEKRSFEILKDAKLKASMIYLDDITKRYLTLMEDSLRGP